MFRHYLIALKYVHVKQELNEFEENRCFSLLIKGKKKCSLLKKALV